MSEPIHHPTPPHVVDLNAKMKLPVDQEVYIRPFQKNDSLSFVEAVHDSVDTVGVWMA
jgi:hypothetical protein